MTAFLLQEKARAGLAGSIRTSHYIPSYHSCREGRGSLQKEGIPATKWLDDCVLTIPLGEK